MERGGGDHASSPTTTIPASPPHTAVVGGSDSHTTTQTASVPKDTHQSEHTSADWIVANFARDITDIRHVLAIYLYGSRVYGTALEGVSDWDYIIILDEGPDPEVTVQGKAEDADATLMSEARFVSLLQQHAMSMVECLFLPPEKVFLQRKDFAADWRCDLQQLRKSVSARVGHSWSKAQKKLQVAREVYIGKKSLFHSFRILAFGIQLAQHGRIADYAVMNELWDEIKANPSEDWEDYKKLYKARWNKLKSEFRTTAPKDWN